MLQAARSREDSLRADFFADVGLPGEAGANSELPRTEHGVRTAFELEECPECGFLFSTPERYGTTKVPVNGGVQVGPAAFVEGFAPTFSVTRSARGNETQVGFVGKF